MRRMGIVIALGCLAAPACAEQAPALPAKVESAIKARLEAGQYAALTIVVVADGQAAIYPFGELGSGKAPAADTVFEIGSVTKTMTATLLADQVQRGKLKLDAPVASLLPGLRILRTPARRLRWRTSPPSARACPGCPRIWRCRPG